MDYELIFWVVAGIVGLISLGVMAYLGKKESQHYVEWVADGDWE
jgi:hypothetical protein